MVVLIKTMETFVDHTVYLFFASLKHAVILGCSIKFVFITSKKKKRLFRSSKILFSL